MSQWVAELLIKSTLLFLVLAGLSWLRVRMSADTRARLFVVGFVASVLLPVSILIGPDVVVWQTSLDGEPAKTASIALSVENVRSPTAYADVSRDLNTITHSDAGSQTHPFLKFVLNACFLISLLAISRLLLQNLRTNRAMRNLQAVNNAELVREFEALRIALCAQRKIRLCWQEGSPSSLTWGVFTPTVGLPADFAEWPVLKRRAALVHEIAHILRNDCATLLLARFVAALYWWHPLVWLLVAQFKQDVERAADDQVLAHGVQSGSYAKYLTEIASRNSTMIGISIAMASSGRTLKARIRALMATEQRRTTMSKTTQLIILVSGLVSVSMLGTFQVAAAPLTQDREHIRLYSSAPIYPSSLLEQSVEGYVDLEFDIDAYGTTSNIRVLGQVPSSGEFAQSAIDAMQTFRYLPKIEDGLAVVDQGVRTRIQFSLANDKHTSEDETENQQPDGLTAMTQSVAKSNRDLKARLTVAAQEADIEQDGERFLDLAELSYSEQPEMAGYFLLRATQLGVRDSRKLALLKAKTLYELGDMERSRELFENIVQREDESNITSNWIARIDYMIKRRALVHDELISQR